jgi:hypothetical protein
MGDKVVRMIHWIRGRRQVKFIIVLNDLSWHNQGSESERCSALVDNRRNAVTAGHKFVLTNPEEDEQTFRQLQVLFVP